MHEALESIIKAHGLENECWQHEGDGEHYSTEAALGTVYVELRMFSYSDNGYRAIFSLHYGHQGPYDWESFSVDMGQISEEVKDWF